jgi:hypothetical protein
MRGRQQHCHRNSFRRNDGNPDDDRDHDSITEDISASTREELINTLGDFKPYASAINKVHRRLTKQPLQETSIDYETIHKAISAWTTSERSTSIAKSLWKHFEKPEVHVTAFRVSILFAFVNDDRSWPVVEWKEGNDKELLALFHFDDAHPRSEVGSWLVHYGAGISTDEARWAVTSIAWGVTDMSHLKTLFGAARHFLGILEWDPPVALNLYCGIEPSDPSDQEYVLGVSLTGRLMYYAKCLYLHIHEIELLESEFDKIAHILLRLSDKEGNAVFNVSYG